METGTDHIGHEVTYNLLLRTAEASTVVDRQKYRTRPSLSIPGSKWIPEGLEEA